MSRKYYLKKYGLTEEGYEILSLKQQHKCAICEEISNPKKLLNVDHCHETGKVRGLLCTKCNTALGLFKDTVENLQKAIEYLNRPSEYYTHSNVTKHTKNSFENECKVIAEFKPRRYYKSNIK